MKKSIAILALGCMTLAACGGTPADTDPKQAYIDASVELMCSFTQEELMSDESDAAVEEKAMGVFASYGFDVNDEASMEKLADQFEGDEEVMSAVMAAGMKCLTEK